MQRLSAPDLPSAPGLIMGRNLGELRRKVIASAIYYHARPAALPRRIELLPSHAFGSLEGNRCWMLGHHAEPAAIRAALSQGSSLLVLTGHGDGIDGDLGGGTVLCPVDEEFIASGRARRPICHMTARCHRTNTAIGSDEFLLRRVQPASVSARALVWNSCIGWPARNAFVDRDFGVGVRLAVNPAIGAFITTHQIVITPSDLTDDLASALMRGESIGTVVAAHNASRAARGKAHSLVLFGDPDMCIAPRTARAVSPAKPEHRATDVAPVVVTGELPRRAAARTMRADDAALSSAAAGLIRLTRGDKGGLDRTLADLWGDFVAQLEKEAMHTVWVRTASSVAASPDSRVCNHCGSQATGLVASLPSPLTSQFRLSICPRCEVCENVSAELGFSVKITRNRLRLAGRFPAGTWFGAIVVNNRWPLQTASWAWPKGADGRPRRNVDPSHWLPVVPCTLTVAFAAAGQLGTFTRTLAEAGARRGAFGQGWPGAADVSDDRPSAAIEAAVVPRAPAHLMSSSMPRGCR
ncbi:MAG: hypothetical protein JO084_12475 [Bradyrhizobiaceae bacterium]|nr:hypothetical protein [Bradyrhizobiaceae bacterium]